MSAPKKFGDAPRDSGSREFKNLEPVRRFLYDRLELIPGARSK